MYYTNQETQLKVHLLYKHTGCTQIQGFSYYRPHRGPTPPTPHPPLKMDQHRSIWINMNIHTVLLHAL